MGLPCSIDALDEILSVKHVDAALIGPNDLSIALGGVPHIFSNSLSVVCAVPGQYSSPILHAAVERTIAACKRHKIVPAIHVNDLDSAVYV